MKLLLIQLLLLLLLLLLLAMSPLGRVAVAASLSGIEAEGAWNEKGTLKGC